MPPSPASPPKRDPLPVFDAAALCRATDGDTMLQQELLSAFVRQADGLAVEIRAAARAPIEHLVDRIHALRGSASIVAAARLVEELREVEAQLRAARIDRPLAVRRVLHELGVLRIALGARVVQSTRSPRDGR